MQIVIEIDEELYQSLRYQKQYNPRFLSGYEKTILDGTPLPKGHGRLIDADALEFTCNADECGMLTGCNHCQYHIVTEHEIDNAPTIIEGSDSE